MAVTATLDEVLRVIGPALDMDFYLAVYGDLRETGADPARHYAEDGWREGRDPAPWFSTAAYLRAHPDVRRSGANPFAHYLEAGRREGREVNRSAHAGAYLASLRRSARPAEPPAPEPEAADPEPVSADPSGAARERELMAAEFDATFYLLSYVDVADSGVDPFEHFVTDGWREGRDPNPAFSVDDYLQMYPDIAEAGVNPFLHYLQAGRAEGRTPKHQLGFRYQTLMNLRPVAERLAWARSLPSELPAGSRAGLEAAVARSRTGLRDLHVTVSHDDYTANMGGVQQCLQREDAAAADSGRDHLHLHPAKWWPVVRAEEDAGGLGVLLNGERLGAFEVPALAKALRRLIGSAGPGKRSLAIHSLLGHRADEVAAIAKAAGLADGLFWLHDFASLCAGVHLLRNDVQDCAAPPPDSPACGICSYLPLRARHISEHARLFRALALTVVSPSEPTLKLWRERCDYPASGHVVLPHARLAPRGPAPVSRGKRPLRLAYCGMPVTLKGWPIFRELALTHRDDPRYRFLHLGGATERHLPVDFHEVLADQRRPQLMRETLEALEVDAVLIWPLCRETFSFTAYEATAAGCAIVTWPDSGNVAAFAAEAGRGWVLPDEPALFAAVADGRLTELSRARRKPQLFDLAFSRLSFDAAAA